MGTIWVRREAAARIVEARVAHSEVALDVGPGIRPQAFFRPAVHICAEPFLPYVERMRELHQGDERFVYLNCTWERALGLFPDKALDSVFALDVIEHLDKDEGRALLREAVRVAREQVVIHTPLGFFPQHHPPESNRDRWGMEGGDWQDHRSGWLPEDFEGDWDFVCCRQFHFLDHHDVPLAEPVGAFWAFLNLGAESRRLARVNPARVEQLVTLVADRTRPLRKRVTAWMGRQAS